MSKTGTGKKEKSGSSLMQRIVLILVWLGMFVVFSIMMPNTFFTWVNVTTMLGQKAVLLVLALAIMIPMIGGDYDMSVAAIMTFGAMIVAVLNVWNGVNIVTSVIIGIICCAALGAANGLLCAILELDPFIITMGMQTLIIGIVQMVSGSMTITGIDEGLKKAVYQGRLFGISYVFYYAIIVAAVMFYFFTFTAAGRRVLIVGRSRHVASLSGINVKRVRFLTFLASGAFSGFAGVLYAGMLGAADPTSGINYLMPTFAAVFLSTTVLVPGMFNPWGVAIAVYFLITGTTGLSLMGFSAAVQNVFYGGALIVAIAASQIVKRRQGQIELRAVLAKEKAEMKSGKED